MPIQPAVLDFAPDGTPYSEPFDDVYHSTSGGLGQARHVFLGGNHLPERWQGQRRFVVLETGFGLGLNFLATWAAWRACSGRPRSLCFVSTELHPFGRDDLAKLHAAWPELAELSAELRANWPPLVGGMHRLHLDGGRVCLMLYFGEVAEGLEQLNGFADAIYLDGFSPAKNPDMWRAKVFYLLARHAAPDATLATWTVAGDVREGLRRASFVTEKAPGFGNKHQMLRGHIYPHPERKTFLPPIPDKRHAIVIGAGAAGSAITERLAARGWEIDLVDSLSRAGQGASGNHAGVLRPQPSLDDNRMSRITRQGALYAWRHIARALAGGNLLRAEATGVFHLGEDADTQRRMRAVVERLALPPEVLRYVEPDEASELVGWPLKLGGWHFPGCGWVQPHSLCTANIAAHPMQVRTHWSTTATAIERRGNNWHALDNNGNTLVEAPVMILAPGVGLHTFAQTTPIPLRSARGQVSVLPAETASPPHAVVCCGGYVTPAVDGRRCAGASFDIDDTDSEMRPADQLANLAKLERILPGYTGNPDINRLDFRVGFRPVSPDRLPIVGAVPAISQVEPGMNPDTLPRHPGLWVVSGFGARGLTWAMLIAETLAAMLEGEPLPLERDLVASMDPGRYLFRRPRTHITDDED